MTKTSKYQILLDSSHFVLSILTPSSMFTHLWFMDLLFILSSLSLEICAQSAFVKMVLFFKNIDAALQYTSKPNQITQLKWLTQNEHIWY